MRPRAWFAALIAALHAGSAQPCAMVERAGEVARIAEESALIVWDAKRGIEHFIRRAVFDTAAKDFGFLVPTPAEPELGEADDAIFQRLVEWTQPPRRVVLAGSKETYVESASAPAVVVLQTATVAGLDAAVLRASDAKALSGWLKKHGYASTPALARWLERYVERKWIITAFKIAKTDSGAPRTMTTAVRMSFKTDQPFYPYREPDSRAASSGSRALEVFFIGPQRVDGFVGSRSFWPGRTLWSGEIGDSHRTALSAALKLPTKISADSARLTRFIDLSSPRPGTDELHFSASVDQGKFIDVAAIEAENDRRARAGSVSPSASSQLGSADIAKLLEGAADLEKRNDYHAAVRLLRRAARSGSGKAALQLGDYYDKGRPGIPRDHEESMAWYQKARDLGEQVPAGFR